MNSSGEKKALFEDMPEGLALLDLAFPAILTQLVSLAYTLADMWFVGRLNDVSQLAAVNICTPFVLAGTALANLFGVGGASLISRSLGEGNRERASETSSFCFWAGIFVSLLYSAFVFIFENALLSLSGAGPDTLKYASSYLNWTVVIGALPSVSNVLLGHLIRSEGYSAQAGFGLCMGVALNIVLDPLFILYLGMEIRGAAVATALSSCAAAVYFAVYILRRRGLTSLSLNFRPKAFRREISGEVTMVGLPSCCLSLLSTFSNLAVNKLVSAYGTAALAAMGIAKKINRVSFCLAQGLGQGAMPLLAYNYGMKNIKRMKKVFSITLKTAAVMSLSLMAVSLIWAGPMVKFFIKDEATVACGTMFLRIICLAMLTSAFLFIVITYFQAVGAKREPLIISLLRKGTTDVAFMLVLNSLIGIHGLLWATPAADLIDVAVSVVLLKRYARGKRKNI